MKKYLIIIVLFLVLLLTSCTRRTYGSVATTRNKKEENKVVENKTQLFVAINDGGYGDDWLYALKDRFEEKYKNYSFEEGKMGVQLIIDKNTRYKGTKLVNELPTSTYEVFFTEGVNYYDLITRNLILDITDVLTTSVQYDFVTKETNTNLENETILSKLISTDLADFLKTDDNKYYALPYFDAYYGIIYDVDLFIENNLFFAKDGEGDNLGFVLDESTPKGTGPDGEYNTYDDGLPRTYDEFFKLCDHMVELGIEPITWSGKVQEYLSYFLQQLCVNYEGLENAKTDYYFEGTISTYVTGFDEKGLPIETTKTISKQESYELNNKRAGKYYALSFLERIIDNTTYYNETNCFNQAVTHLDAQKNFLYPRYIKTAGSQEVAMLIDGTWWQNEASGSFDSLVKLYGNEASAKNRRFGIMPLPKANESKVGEPFVISNSGSSYGLISANISSSKIDLAKAFLQFWCTNESLVEFTKTTSATRPFKYTFTEEEYNNLTYFAKQAYDVHNSADYLIPYSKDEDYIRNSAKVGYMWQTTINDSVMGLPSFALHNKNYSARQVFDGLSAFYNPTYWENNLGPFGD